MKPQTTGAVKALLSAASALSNLHPNHAMTPEAMLLALLCDPDVSELDAELEEEPELRRAILESDEARDATGWSARAKEVYQRAWKRAAARERSRPIGERVRSTLQAVMNPGGNVPMVIAMQGRLSVGDLIVGLPGASPPIDSVLARRALVAERFDDEAPLPAVGHASTPDALVDVVALNDDVTPMDFVTDALQRHFGHSPLRALCSMYRIDACGRARVATCTRAEAERRIDAVHEAARPLGFPLSFVYGPRSS